MRSTAHTNIYLSMTKKILIVDDEPELVELFAGVLESAGYAITKAFDGKQALQALAAEAPDLILLDIVMPNTDGFELLSKVKQNPTLQHIKVIMLSNMQGQEYLDKATDLGADDYWYKVNTHLTDLVDKVALLLQ